MCLIKMSAQHPHSLHEYWHKDKTDAQSRFKCVRFKNKRITTFSGKKHKTAMLCLYGKTIRICAFIWHFPLNFHFVRAKRFHTCNRLINSNRRLADRRSIANELAHREQFIDKCVV